MANLCLWIYSRRITGAAVRRPAVRLLVVTFRGEFPSSRNGSKAPRSARIDDMIVSKCGQSPYLIVEFDDDICYCGRIVYTRCLCDTCMLWFSNGVWARPVSLR